MAVRACLQVARMGLAPTLKPVIKTTNANGTKQTSSAHR